MPDRVEQLSFVVEQHPNAREYKDGGWLDGTVAVGGAFRVERDLNPGDRLTVTIASADGEVIASGEVSVVTVGFKPIKLKGFVVGQTRVHKASAA